MIYAHIKVIESKGRSSIFNLLVDTGSVFTWVDGESLKLLGIEPRLEKKFKDDRRKGSFQKNW